MIKGKPYLLLVVGALVLFISSFILEGKNNLSLNIGDTYFVVLLKEAIVVFFFLFLILGFFYWLSEKFKIPLFTIFSNIHIFGTLILTVLFFYFNYKNSETLNSTKTLADILNRTDYNSYLIFSLTAIIFLQFLFIINIFVALIKK